MEIAELGEFGLIRKLVEPFGQPQRSSTVIGVGDDAAVIEAREGQQVLMSTELMMEGIHFDLVYVPLKYLGFKAVTIGVSDIIAMGGTPEQIMISLGISARFRVEDMEDLMSGVREACTLYGVDLVGGDTTSSLTGLAISVTAVGQVLAGEVLRRDGARPNDLICVSGNLGAAYMGLQLLAREKDAYTGAEDFEPRFEGREYILERQMKPIARLDILRSMQSAGVRPSALIDVSDGLASDLLQLCKSSGVGCRVYEQRLPIDHETAAMSEEFGLSPTTAAMNGGEDYELLFTVPLGLKDYVDTLEDVRQIGFVTDESEGYVLVSSAGNETPIRAQGFPELK